MKSLVLSAAMLLASSGAFACSNIIVGKKASVDGSVMVSYNADDYGMFGHLCHYPAGTHPKGHNAPDLRLGFWRVSWRD